MAAILSREDELNKALSADDPVKQGTNPWIDRQRAMGYILSRIFYDPSGRLI